MTETKKDPRVWFITGCSSGLGRLLAEEALKAGDKVVATARNIATIVDLEKQYPKAARALSLDVTHPDQIKTAAEQALDHFGHIDVLVNNAGYGLMGALEEAADKDIRRQVETNVFGVVNVTRAFLPHLRARKAGHIINVSSIAGLIATPGLGYYNLTKFAVEGFTEALSLEVAPLGIKVTLIEPGPFRTEFLAGSLVESGERIEDYATTSGKTLINMRKGNGTQKGDPVKGVHAIMQVAAAPEPPLRLLLGAIAHTRAQAKIAMIERDMKAWESVTLGADFPEGAVALMIKTIFFDLGGVLLTNGLDESQRAYMLPQFDLDIAEYNKRHHEANELWERGRCTVRQYLDKTVFYEPRSFSFEQFWDGIKAESKMLHPECIAIAQTLADSGQYRLCTLNNESRELNDYRIEAFGLRKIFTTFICSGYVHEMKPHADIYRSALEITQVDAASSVFIDDRDYNVEPARSLGMHGITFTSPAQLRAELAKLGVSV